MFLYLQGSLLDLEPDQPRLVWCTIKIFNRCCCLQFGHWKLQPVGNTLDLVLSSEPHRAQEVEIEGHLGDRDHNMIHFLINCKKSGIDNCMIVPNFKRANYVGLRNRLGSINWWDLLSNQSNEAMWLKFREVFDTGVNECSLTEAEGGTKHSVHVL